MPKATAVVVADRLNQVMQWLLDGCSRGVIIRNCSEWNLSERRIEQMMAEATTMITEQAKKHTEQAFELNLERLFDLYHATKTTGNHKTALAVIRELNALLGLYATKPSEIKLQMDQPTQEIDLSGLSTEQLLAFAQALKD